MSLSRENIIDRIESAMEHGTVFTASQAMDRRTATLEVIVEILIEQDERIAKLEHELETLRGELLG